MGSAAGSGVGGSDRSVSGRATSSSPSRPSAAATHSRGNSAAVAGERITSPASASPSRSTTALASGPAAIRSRGFSPARKKCAVPEATPTDIASRCAPRGAPGTRRVAITPWIPRAADAPRASCPGPVNMARIASPPNLRISPPSTPTAARSATNTALIASASVSEPMRPRRARRSLSAVKPETSPKTKVASSSRHAFSGSESSQIR